VDTPYQTGSVLAGKYRIERVLGAGAMGVVVAALHLSLERRVAVKFLLPTAVKNPEAVARFTREGRAAAKIQSEHVAKVLDVGEVEGGSPYIVMEYLEGCDLATVLEQHGPMPVGEAVDAVLQACEALAEAHALGIVHRDLKPANLFRTHRADGSPITKVLDFGLSKAHRPGELALTRSAATMGSPRYMSPEQIRSARDVDARSDIWALGVILYELLAGQAPFRGEGPTELAAKIIEDQPRSLREPRPDVAESLESVIFRCLAKSPAERWGDVAALARALADHAETSMSTANRVVRIIERVGLAARSDAAAPDAPVVVSMAPGRASLGSTRSRKRILLASGAAVLTVAAAAAMRMGTAAPPLDDAGTSSPVARAPALSAIPRPHPDAPRPEPAGSSAAMTSALPARRLVRATAASATPPAQTPRNPLDVQLK